MKIINARKMFKYINIYIDERLIAIFTWNILGSFLTLVPFTNNIEGGPLLILE